MQKDKQFYDDFFTNHDVNVHNHSDRFLSVSGLLTGKVLDVACGTGTLADYYSGVYVGVDISNVALDKARAVRRKDAKFHAFDFTKNVSVIPDSFDSVYVGEFLEHIEDDSMVFKNILKCCKSNATIVVSVPNGDRVPDESHCRTFTVPQIRREYSKYGRITFVNWSGAHDRIIFFISRGEAPRHEVSLVMIVKDEELGLEKAILSALPYVDHVVISVDSLSQDKTLEIANLYADQLKQHEWHDDFSEARNFAQSDVTTPWILFLDGHEYIERVGNYAASLESEAEGVMVTVRMETGLTFMFPRLYRRHVKFTGAVHNLNEIKTKHFNPKFTIVHDREHGQSKDAIARREAQRDRMLPRIMKARLKENKRDVRALFHLGNYYMLLKEWKVAISYYKQYLKYGDMPEECYLMSLNQSLCHQMLGQNVRALFACHKADKLLPGRWETARIYGNIYFLAGFWQKASQWLVQSFSDNKRRYLYEPFPRDLQIIWDMLAMCFMNMNEKAKAVTALERAIACAKNDAERSFYTTKLSLMKQL